MKRSTLIFVLSLVLGIAVFAGCTDKAPNADNKAVDKPLPIKIGVLPIEDNLPFYVAEADQLFENAGLEVTLVPFASAQERDVAFQAGQIDAEVADLVAVALLKKSGAGVKVASIGLGANPQEGRFALLVSPGSNIKAPAELKNVPIAISQNTVIEFVTDMMLRGQGISDADIKKLSIPKIPVRMQMLESGQIQAAVLPDPLASLAEKQGARVLLDDTLLKTNLTQTVLVFSEKSIENNRKAVRKIVEIYGAAGKAITDNPDQYRALLIDKAKIPEPIKDTYKCPTFTKPERPKEEDFNRVMGWMVDKNLLEKAYVYDELVDSSLLSR